MSLARIVVVGGGGHAAVVIETLRAAGQFAIIGIVDPKAQHPDVLGVPVIGGDDRLPGLRAEGVAAAVVALGGNALRQTVGTRLLEQGFQLPPVIHPTALISPSASIEFGVVVMARAIIGTRTQIKALAIVNSGAIVEHDNIVGAAAHVAPGVALAGTVHVGDRTLIGAGSAVRPGIRIGADAVVGAGSAVVTDIGDGAVVGGVPARPLRHHRVASR